MRARIEIFLLLAVAVLFAGCFKDEKLGTRMNIELYSQNVADDPVMRTTSEIEGYAFWVEKGSKWEVTTWEDALGMRITNSDNPTEQLTTPDEMANYDTEAEYQLSFELWASNAFLVIVDKTNRIYATRLYETPMNLPEVFTQLHLYAHRKSSSANGWNVINPFPDEAREPLVPKEPEVPEDNEGAENTEGTEEDSSTEESGGTDGETE